MVDPCTLLTLLATVLRLPAAPALCKLSCIGLPLAALVVGTLPDVASSLIFPAEIPHHNASPVLHVRRVYFGRELFDQREEVEVIGETILVVLVSVNFVLIMLWICGSVLAALSFWS